MYIVDKNNNTLIQAGKATFKECGIKERNHLQEWIAKNPEILGEELLIIQKEFNDFENTKERPDLLALDKEGNLVVIENKLDDTGRDVVWQALKYASYVAPFSADDIVAVFKQYLASAAESYDGILSEFFETKDYRSMLNKNNQRIMLIAANFRKEVTSTVLWLLNNYGLSIQCFKVSLARFQDKLLLDLKQIIPLPDAGDFQIRLARKKKEDLEEVREKHKQCMDFWRQLYVEMNKCNSFCRNHSPSKDTWIGLAVGISGVSLNMNATGNRADCKIYINRGKEMNKKIFDFLLPYKEEVERIFGHKLEWQRRDNSSTSFIVYQLDGVSVYNKEDWPQINAFFLENVPRMMEAFKKPLADLKRAKLD